jgi:hypothetical protein
MLIYFVSRFLCEAPHSEWNSTIWTPMKEDPEGDEVKGRGLGIKLYQAL